MPRRRNSKARRKHSKKGAPVPCEDRGSHHTFLEGVKASVSYVVVTGNHVWVAANADVLAAAYTAFSVLLDAGAV